MTRLGKDRTQRQDARRRENLPLILPNFMDTEKKEFNNTGYQVGHPLRFASSSRSRTLRALIATSPKIYRYIKKYRTDRILRTQRFDKIRNPRTETSYVTRQKQPSKTTDPAHAENRTPRKMPAKYLNS